MVGQRVGAMAVGLVVACVAGSGCSSARDNAASTSSAIQGGTIDYNHPYAVGVCVGAPGQCQLICSGALIAPNLVMTARHCVDQTPQTIDCTTATFGGLHTSTSGFYITTNSSEWQISVGWHTVKQIITTPGTKVCGNDMALLELNDVIAPSEAPNVTPVVQYSMTDHTRYSTTVTAIGYGIDAPSDMTSSGQRRIRQDINLQCIPGDATIDCGSLAGAQLTANEFVSGDGTCEGDSGSSAYEQKEFNGGVPVSFGVLSRGSSDATTCIGGVYTRTDAWKDFIIQNALQAAKDGAYTPPPWTQPPLPDGGTPPPPGQGVLGDACSSNTDCASKLCESLDGQSYICTQPCDNSAGSCPSGYTCQAAGSQSYCFPAPATPPPPGGGGGTKTVTTTTSCSLGPMGPDPTKPVPWRAGAVIAAIGLAFLRRRRGSSVQ